MSVTGRFSTMPVPDLIQWARGAQRTGALTLWGEGGTAIQVAFRDGQISFTSTSDPSQRYSRYLVYRGLCGQEQIDEALRYQKETGTMMAAALVRWGALRQEQARASLMRKSFEDLCGALLWPEGTFLFVPQARASNDLLAIDVDPVNVVMEAARRADHWARMTASMNTGSFFEATEDAWPERARWEDEEAARMVRALLDGRTNLADLRATLPFSRFTVWRAVWELREKGLIIPRSGALAQETSDRIRLRETERSPATRARRDAAFDIDDVPVHSIGGFAASSD